MNIQEVVQSMRNMSHMLSEYSYPIKPLEDEEIVYPLKSRTLTVDGYELAINLNIAQYGKFNIEILQIESVRSIFLPMALLVKMAKFFLGKEQICYLDYYRNNRKVYCWTVRRKKGSPLPPLGEVLQKEFEGFSYYAAKPQMN